MNLSQSKPIEILLVEDSPSDAALTIEALKAGKIANRLTHVEDGVEAMDFLRHRGKYADAARPDLIMLDLNLPRMDGRDVLAEIKTDQSLKIIPIKHGKCNTYRNKQASNKDAKPKNNLEHPF